jgi:hypothetical protein
MRGFSLFLLLLVTFFLALMPSMVARTPDSVEMWAFVAFFGMLGTLEKFAFWILFLLIADKLSSEIELPWAPLAFIALVAVGFVVDIWLRFGFRIEDIMRQVGPPEPSAFVARYIPIFAACAVTALHRLTMRVFGAAH